METQWQILRSFQNIFVAGTEEVHEQIRMEYLSRQKLAAGHNLTAVQKLTVLDPCQVMKDSTHDTCFVGKYAYK
jgi:hypothetical protein